MLKKKFENAKERWVEKLISTLWAIKTSPRGNSNQMLFSLMYDIEVVKPMNIKVSTMSSVLTKL